MNPDRWLWRLALACVLCTLPSLHCPLFGQPAFFEPKEHFYKAKGGAVGVTWEVPRPTVEEGAELVATLVVSRATNPTEVVRPDLKALPAFADAFAVTDVPEPPPKADAKEVRFGYKLKPRNRSVAEVPALEFYYFNPSAAPNKSQFRMTMADAVPIAVTAPPRPPSSALAEPDRLFEVATGPAVLDAPFVPCDWAWLAAALLGPLAACAWYLAWRRLFPGAARLAHLRRSRAARRAREAIRRADRTPDPPAAVAAAVLGYLRTRFPLPESAATPSEIATALSAAQVPAEVAEQAAGVFRACDQARFAPADTGGAALAAAAQAVVARLEALA
jgi:hypothetical protein